MGRYAAHVHSCTKLASRVAACPCRELLELQAKPKTKPGRVHAGGCTEEGGTGATGAATPDITARGSEELLPSTGRGSESARSGGHRLSVAAPGTPEVRSSEAQQLPSSEAAGSV